MLHYYSIYYIFRFIFILQSCAPATRTRIFFYHLSFYEGHSSFEMCRPLPVVTVAQMMVLHLSDTGFREFNRLSQDLARFFLTRAYFAHTIEKDYYNISKKHKT